MNLVVEIDYVFECVKFFLYGKVDNDSSYHAVTCFSRVFYRRFYDYSKYNQFLIANYFDDSSVVSMDEIIFVVV